MMFHSVSTLHRRRLRLLLGAALLTLSAMFQTSSAQGAYTLTLAISDSLGNSTSVTSGPITGFGSVTFNEPFPLPTSTRVFTEFSSLTITATGNETAASSFVNKADIAGAVLSGAGTVDLFVTLTASGFMMPSGPVTAIESISSTSPPLSFDTYTTTGTLGGSTVATLSIPGAPGFGAVSNFPPGTGLTLSSPYTAVLAQSIINIANTFSLTSSLNWSAGGGGGPVPVPPTMVLALTGVIGIGLSRLRRFRWKDYASL